MKKNIKFVAVFMTVIILSNSIYSTAMAMDESEVIVSEISADDTEVIESEIYSDNSEPESDIKDSVSTAIKDRNEAKKAARQERREARLERIKQRREERKQRQDSLKKEIEEKKSEASDKISSDLEKKKENNDILNKDDVDERFNHALEGHISDKVEDATEKVENKKEDAVEKYNKVQTTKNNIKSGIVKVATVIKYGPDIIKKGAKAAVVAKIAKKVVEIKATKAGVKVALGTAVLKAKLGNVFGSLFNYNGSKHKSTVKSASTEPTTAKSAKKADTKKKTEVIQEEEKPADTVTIQDEAAPLAGPERPAFTDTDPDSGLPSPVIPLASVGGLVAVLAILKKLKLIF